MAVTTGLPNSEGMMRTVSCSWISWNIVAWGAGGERAAGGAAGAEPPASSTSRSLDRWMARPRRPCTSTNFQTGRMANVCALALVVTA
eukprot:7380412-Prymnesium_polylepis.2